MGMISKWIALLTILFTAPLAHASGYGIWSEFMAFDEVETYLPALARHGASLNIAIREENMHSPELYSLWRKADELGVELKPWLLLRQDQVDHS